MSWILAALNAPEHMVEKARGLVKQTPSSLFQIDNPGFFLVAGGISETCFFHQHGDNGAGWAVLGTGIFLKENSCTMMTQSTWEAILRAETPSLPENGHYVVCRWNTDRTEFFTDKLGLRTAYYCHQDQYLICSTRLDWLARITENQQIDFGIFGSHWLTSNQLDTRSPIKNTRRLGAGGRLCFSNQKISIAENLWQPDSQESSVTDFTNTLKAFCNPQLPEGLNLSLGLSGGLDSRTLLSLINRNSVTSVHTFGSDDKEDVCTAREIASRIGLSHIVIDSPVPNVDTCIQLLRMQAAQTQGLTAASAVSGLNSYALLRKKGLAIIDGGFGEVARRQFLNRLRIKGKSLIKKGAFNAVLPFIAFHRADIFTPEINVIMQQGVARQFEKAWLELPDDKLENKLDLLSTRTRLPNFFGYEQNRLDGLILNYMPFAQPKLLDIVLNLPVRKRKDGRLFKSIIRSSFNSLTDIPLVKGAYTYPFNFSGAGAYLWTKAKSNLLPAPLSTKRLQFLWQLKPFVYALMSTQATIQYAPYDTPKIQQQIKAFYEKNDSSAANFIDWWLTFEIWRQEISNPV